MFDVTGDDIAQLNDTDLRTLIGLLCEVELVVRDISPIHAIWSGNQTAADGGLDVKVEVPEGTVICGSIPRRLTGIQVKTPDMARGDILAEMRPRPGGTSARKAAKAVKRTRGAKKDPQADAQAGVLRGVIRELAAQHGAYLIVSSNGSTTASALEARRQAMRDALHDEPHAGDLYTDFYDRGRIATWVRMYAGITAWVRARCKRPLTGWQPYGDWTNDQGSDYLVDEHNRLEWAEASPQATTSLVASMDRLRNELARPGAVVRLVGMPGMGKTRLVQALFDARVGEHPLPIAHAVYTNLADAPDPPPLTLLTNLIQDNRRAVMVVDNCPPDVHERLAMKCAAANVTVSLITIEYDVREDQPEGTQVVRLDRSSDEIIEALVQRRSPHVSKVDAQTIAHAAGGNARIALAIASTVAATDSLAGMSSTELFDRLFQQRNPNDPPLTDAAHALSLVYSYEGTEVIDDGAELNVLGRLVGQDAQKMYSATRTLMDRDLVQARGPWRAVLPHALANRLARAALKHVPAVNLQALIGHSERLRRSFARRLGYLHDSSDAQAIVDSWLQPAGQMGDYAAYTSLEKDILRNIAPVNPEAALAVLERGATTLLATPNDTPSPVPLLRSLAYERERFVRSAHLLARVVAGIAPPEDRWGHRTAFVSLFTSMLSGTEATIAERHTLLDTLLGRADPALDDLVLEAVAATLEATHFTSVHSFSFGARPRSAGLHLNTLVQAKDWYTAALAFAISLINSRGAFRDDLLATIARKFRGLWLLGVIPDELDGAMRAIHAQGFWRAGWNACRESLQYDVPSGDPARDARLQALAAAMAPDSLPERIRGIVLGSDGVPFAAPEIDGDDVEGATAYWERMTVSLAEEAVATPTVLTALLPELMQDGRHAYTFGRALGQHHADVRSLWRQVLGVRSNIRSQTHGVSFLNGIVHGVATSDPYLAQQLVEEAASTGQLEAQLPSLQCAFAFGSRGVALLIEHIRRADVPIDAYRALAFGRCVEHLEGAALSNLVDAIAQAEKGFVVAIQVLAMRFFGCRWSSEPPPAEIVALGRQLLARWTTEDVESVAEYDMTLIVKPCIAGASGSASALQLVQWIRDLPFPYGKGADVALEVLKVILAEHGAAALDMLYPGPDASVPAIVERFDAGHKPNPTSALPTADLRDWCAADPDHRVPHAARFIRFAERPQSNDLTQLHVMTWTAQAKVLFKAAAVPDLALAIFVARICSRVGRWLHPDQIEAHLVLLDDKEVLHAVSAATLAAHRERMRQVITDEREQEWSRQRTQDERFE